MTLLIVILRSGVGRRTALSKLTTARADREASGMPRPTFETGGRRFRLPTSRVPDYDARWNSDPAVEAGRSHDPFLATSSLELVKGSDKMSTGGSEVPGQSSIQYEWQMLNWQCARSSLPSSRSASSFLASLALTVAQSVVEVFILCFAGYVLSRAGVTDKATQRKLNVINVSLFTPALLFSKVSCLRSMSTTQLNRSGRIFIDSGEIEGDVDYTARVSARKSEKSKAHTGSFVIVTSLSAAVAWGMSKMLGLKRSQTSVMLGGVHSFAEDNRAFAMCAAMFQNSNSLPIALIQVSFPDNIFDRLTCAVAGHRGATSQMGS